MRRGCLLVAAAAVALLFVAVACNGGNDGGSEPTVDRVRVRVYEWSYDPSVASVRAGPITFQADNIGQLTHELKIVRTDIEFEELPTLEDGTVDEEAEGIETVGALLEIRDGRSDSGTFDLAAGSYVLLCNILEVRELPTGEIVTDVHYELGMVAAFEVTE